MKMRTVQEILRELDSDRLIDTYLYDFPINYQKHKDNTVAEINEQYRSKLLDFIERLRTMPIKQKKDGQPWLFYAHRYIQDEYDDVLFNLIPLNEFREKGYDCPSYAYEFDDQAEIVGYYVAETPLMKRHLYDFMSDLMNEASFFGFEQQHLKEERDELERRVKEVNDGTAELIPWEDVKSEFAERLDEESEDERELHNKVRQAAMDYSDHSKRKELDAVRKLLENQK